MVLELTAKLTGILEGPNTNGKVIYFTVYQGHASPAFQSLAAVLLEKYTYEMLTTEPSK